MDFFYIFSFKIPGSRLRINWVPRDTVRSRGPWWCPTVGRHAHDLGLTARGGAPRWDRTLTIRDWRPASGCVCGTVSQEGLMLMARRGARNTGVIKQHRSLVLIRSTCDDTRVKHQDGFPIGNFSNITHISQTVIIISPTNTLISGISKPQFEFPSL